MRRISTMVVILMVLAALFSTQAFALSNASNSRPALRLPDGQPATVRYGDWLAGANSTIDITIRNVPPDAVVPNGTYAGWCIEEFVRGGLRGEQALLYGTVGIDLPSDVADFPWNEINYVINHKIRGDGKSDLDFFKDVQTAIWLLLGEKNPEFGVSPEALQMAEEAKAHPDYVPGDGDLVAVVVYSDGIDRENFKGAQETIIEVPQHDTNTPTATATITNTPSEPTATFTSTATVTETATNTATATVTATATDTATATATATNTATATTTATATNTATATATNTITPTATFTPTGTLTPPVCIPTVVTADFSRVNVGQSVEGFGKVAPDLTINANGGTAVKIDQSEASPAAYTATSDKIVNGGIDTNGGFSDMTKVKAKDAHQYTFTFAQGISVSNFSVRMLDFGDFNPTENDFHVVTMTAFGPNNIVVDTLVLSYTTDGRISPLYGDLKVAGDAILSSPGQPGHWNWSVSGTGITRVTLKFGPGHDPYIGFDSLSYTIECLACQLREPIIADFSQVNVGQSVEGLGKVASGLTINANGGRADKIDQSEASPAAYTATSDKIVNGGIDTNGGFSDMINVKAKEAHQYTFTFAPGFAVSNFSVRMLDYGDFNPTQSDSHIVTMTAYGPNNTVVDTQVIDFNTVGRASSKYGDLRLSGDAIYATPGLPGLWTWSVSGTGITRVTLDFGPGYDPYIGFDSLMFMTDCP